MIKQPTQASYAARLERVVDYIYDHLDEDVSIDRLAQIACLSPYHWHRIYTAMRAETVAATVKRLRLQRAADRLANSEQPIKKIAERAGYRAIESFNRAFKEVYQKAPADYRATGSHAAFKAASAANDANLFNVELVQLPATQCAAVQHSGSYMQIDQAMGSLFTCLGEHGMLTEQSEMLAMFLDDPSSVPEKQLRSYACSPVPGPDAPPEPLAQLTIAGGLYARLHYQGPYADMSNAYHWLYGVWLPQSGYEAADEPAFEKYLNNPLQVAPTQLLTDIHLPLMSMP